MRDTRDANINYPLLLQQTYHEALGRNEVSQKHWQKVKEEYKSLESLLRELPNELSKDVMVPVAPRALMRGRIVHSNEILVCLGQGYFVKRSAAQAVAICQRREKICCNMLQSLERERELFLGRSNLPLQEDAFGQELIEEYDEEKEALWLAEHKQKEREYRKKLAELRTKEKETVTDEESLWRRLDELELQEELEEELDRLHADDSDDEEEVEEEEETEEECEVEDVREESGRKGVCNNAERDMVEVKEDGLLTSRSTSGRRVSFVGVHEQKMHGCGEGDEAELKIVFKHSPNTTNALSHEPGEVSSIQSPGELYTYFKDKLLTKRKSILKKTSSYDSVLICAQSERIGEKLPNEEREEFENINDLPTPPPILQNVVERSVAESTVASTGSRTVSRFKAMRQLKKR